MQSVRIEPAHPGQNFALLVDVTCDCGANGLQNEATGGTSFRHAVPVADEADMILACTGCGRKYRLHPQSGHIHISSE